MPGDADTPPADDAIPEGLDGQSAAVPESAREAARLARLRRSASRLDTDPRWVDAARRVRRRMPGDAKFGDPLSTAGRAPVEVIARGVTTLRSEPESLVKEIGLGALQLWQSVSEAAGRGRGDREMALLFTDLVGFSTWALQAGDGPALELLREVGVVVEAKIETRGGRLVKRLGDGLMATFLDARDAAQAALDAHDALAVVEVGGYRPRMRAGLHWGRPRKLGGDYLGVDVNIAARVADAAKAGQVLASEAMVDRLAGTDLAVSRPRRLKAEGAPRELQVAVISRR